MRVQFEKYLLATKKFPLEFDSKESEGMMVNDIQEAMLYDSEKDVENELGNFDFPEDYQALPLKVIYEF